MPASGDTQGILREAEAAEEEDNRGGGVGVEPLDAVDNSRWNEGARSNGEGGATEGGDDNPAVTTCTSRDAEGCSDTVGGATAPSRVCGVRTCGDANDATRLAGVRCVVRLRRRASAFARAASMLVHVVWEWFDVIDEKLVGVGRCSLFRKVYFAQHQPFRAAHTFSPHDFLTLPTRVVVVQTSPFLGSPSISPFSSPNPTLPDHHVGTLVADSGLPSPWLAAHGGAVSLGERTCDVCDVCGARGGGRPGVVVSPLHARGASANPTDLPPVPDPTCFVLNSHHRAPGPTETTTTNTPEATNPSNDTAAGRRRESHMGTWLECFVCPHSIHKHGRSSMSVLEDTSHSNTLILPHGRVGEVQRECDGGRCM